MSTKFYRRRGVVSTLTYNHLSQVLDQAIPVSSTFLPFPTKSKDIPSFIEDLTQQFLEVPLRSGNVMDSTFLQYMKNHAEKLERFCTSSENVQRICHFRKTCLAPKNAYENFKEIEYKSKTGLKSRIFLQDEKGTYIPNVWNVNP